MPTWRFYDGGAQNNYELEIWQLVDSDGEIIEQYRSEELSEEFEHSSIIEGDERNSVLVPKDNSD